MSAPADRHRDDLPPDTSTGDAETLAMMARTLEDSRPVPRVEFRGDLRRQLAQGPKRLSPIRRRHLTRWQPLAASYAALGTALLAVAAIGVAGAGPFGH
jgi:hypothetical protein